MLHDMFIVCVNPIPIVLSKHVQQLMPFSIAIQAHNNLQLTNAPYKSYKGVQHAQSPRVNV
jgi:hypothetical protein